MSLHDVFEDIGHNVRRRITTSSRGVAGAEPAQARDGYRRVMVDGKSELVHRVLWAMRTGSWPVLDVDHINGDRGDNRPENLRECARAHNLHNQGLRTDNTSGYKGVIRRRGRWRGQVMAHGTLHCTEYFSCPDACAVATRTLRALVHGTYANDGGTHVI